MKATKRREREGVNSGGRWWGEIAPILDGGVASRERVEKRGGGDDGNVELARLGEFSRTGGGAGEDVSLDFDELRECIARCGVDKYRAGEQIKTGEKVAVMKTLYHEWPGAVSALIADQGSPHGIVFRALLLTAGILSLRADLGALSPGAAGASRS